MGCYRIRLALAQLAQESHSPNFHQVHSGLAQLTVIRERKCLDCHHIQLDLAQATQESHSLGRYQVHFDLAQVAVAQERRYLDCSRTQLDLVQGIQESHCLECYPIHLAQAMVVTTQKNHCLNCYRLNFDLHWNLRQVDKAEALVLILSLHLMPLLIFQMLLLTRLPEYLKEAPQQSIALHLRVQGHFVVLWLFLTECQYLAGHPNLDLHGLLLLW
jgi:hypothetical protein